MAGLRSPSPAPWCWADRNDDFRSVALPHDRLLRAGRALAGGLCVSAFIADRASFDAEFLKSVWISAIPALVGAAAVSYFVTPQWAQRVWTGWLLIMPIGGLIALGYWLNSTFCGNNMRRPERVMR